MKIESLGHTAWISTDGAWALEKNSTAGINEAFPKRVTEEAKVGGGVWGNSLIGWPGEAGPFATDTSPDVPGVRSNIVSIDVKRSRVITPSSSHLSQIVMDWEEWFTPLNARWNSAEAVPVLGDYRSTDPNVIRQHLLWLTRAGITSIMVDWSNNLHGISNWADCVIRSI